MADDEVLGVFFADAPRPDLNVPVAAAQTPVGLGPTRGAAISRVAGAGGFRDTRPASAIWKTLIWSCRLSLECAPAPVSSGLIPPAPPPHDTTRTHTLSLPALARLHLPSAQVAGAHGNAAITSRTLGGLSFARSAVARGGCCQGVQLLTLSLASGFSCRVLLAIHVRYEAMVGCAGLKGTHGI